MIDGSEEQKLQSSRVLENTVTFGAKINCHPRIFESAVYLFR